MLQIKFEIEPSKITRGFNYDWKGMDVRNKGVKWSFAPLLEIRTKNQKFLANLKPGAQFRLNWFNSCIDSLFAGMTPTVNKNQVHCPGVVQWWVCISLMSAALPVCRSKLRNLRADCSTVGLLLRNKNMATKLRVNFKLRLEAFFRMWMLNAGNAVSQWVLIADSHVLL